MKYLMEINYLKTYFFTESGVVPAVDKVSFFIKEGETVALVGESGSGKSITSLSIMGLIDSPGKIVEGEILFDGKDLTLLSEKELRKIRGNDVAMIFQEPLTSLNPVLKIGDQLSETIILHQNMDKRKVREISIHLQVGIPRMKTIK